jgi:hypothetical protein
MPVPDEIGFFAVLFFSYVRSQNCEQKDVVTIKELQGVGFSDPFP